ncbi:MAG: helix-turn-helix transcriptional regulator [Polyangiaceae bacterium]|nr:helix-turn-helix transcriptional regulator [Polyangiaceae bacterium]
MKIRFTNDALESIREKRAWWATNRDKAPDLFRTELAAVIARLKSGTFEGAKLYTVRRGRRIWRILMPKTRHHVYFWRDAAGQSTEVLLVWNAQGGTAPDSVLTASEREVLDLIQTGLSNAEIARMRSRSVRTVANQVAALLEKTGCISRRGLTALPRS